MSNFFVPRKKKAGPVPKDNDKYCQIIILVGLGGLRTGVTSRVASSWWTNEELVWMGENIEKPIWMRKTTKRKVKWIFSKRGGGGVARVASFPLKIGEEKWCWRTLCCLLSRTMHSIEPTVLQFGWAWFSRNLHRQVFFHICFFWCRH